MSGGKERASPAGKTPRRLGEDEPFASTFWADEVEDSVLRVDTRPMPLDAAKPFPWHRSVAVRTFLFAFVATHVPLLLLVSLLVARPEIMSAFNVLLLTLATALLATGFVMACLWRQFRPLREAADGLRDFMRKGEPLRLTPGANDEVGRLVRILVLAFAHLDRSRAPLLQAGGLVLLDRAQRGGDGVSATPRTMALVEADQWQQVEECGDLDGMMELQTALNRALSHGLRDGELLLPWGRGRYLVIMDGRGSDAVERLSEVNGGMILSCLKQPLTFTAAVEGRSAHMTSWAATLQRLEHKLFSMRLDGRRADVR
jgi:hypothetical protein